MLNNFKLDIGFRNNKLNKLIRNLNYYKQTSDSDDGCYLLV